MLPSLLVKAGLAEGRWDRGRDSVGFYYPAGPI